MRVHYLQHVPFEDLGSIEPWLMTQGHRISATALYANQTPPNVEDFDWLIVMGGPMGVYDTHEYPWLNAEKEFIRAAINNGRIVLGICLGAQLIADVCGAKVHRNAFREIGWHPLRPNLDLRDDPLTARFPDEMAVFHWHGDTFDLPEKARLLASSDACRNQGFALGDRVIGLQFHLETTEASAQALITHCASELDDSQYVQSAAEIMADPTRFQAINQLMAKILCYCESVGSV